MPASIKRPANYFIQLNNAQDKRNTASATWGLLLCKFYYRIAVTGFDPEKVVARNKIGYVNLFFEQANYMQTELL